MQKQETAWTRRSGPWHLVRRGDEGRGRPRRRLREDGVLDVRDLGGRIRPHRLAGYRRPDQYIAAPALDRLTWPVLLVSAPLVFTAACTAYNAIKTASEEYAAGTGRAEGCSNQEGCEQTSHAGRSKPFNASEATWCDGNDPSRVLDS